MPAGNIMPRTEAFWKDNILLAGSAYYPMVIQQYEAKNTGALLYEPHTICSMTELQSINIPFGSTDHRYGCTILDAGTYDIVCSTWFAIAAGGDGRGTSNIYLDGTQVYGTTFFDIGPNGTIYTYGTFLGFAWAGGALDIENQLPWVAGTTGGGDPTVTFRAWTVQVRRYG